MGTSQEPWPIAAIIPSAGGTAVQPLDAHTAYTTTLLHFRAHAAYLGRMSVFGSPRGLITALVPSSASR
jgi:hypothetical protein